MLRESAARVSGLHPQHQGRDETLEVPITQSLYVLDLIDFTLLGLSLARLPYGMKEFYPHIPHIIHIAMLISN